MARIMCTVCNIRAGKTGSKGSETSPHADMCNYCFEEGGYENQHSDSNHHGIAKDGPQNDYEVAELADFMPTCWICHPELNLAQQPASPQAGQPKVQGFRRTQLNHKEMCTHAQTPKARRTCKNAFWAGVKVIQEAQKLTEDQAWEQAIKHLVANGQGVAQPTTKKPTKFTVAPKGHVGVGNASLAAVKAHPLRKVCTNEAHYDEMIGMGACTTCGQEAE